MVGCVKCRHASAGCAKCNPRRFTLRSRCSRNAKRASECAKAFRVWLVTTQGLTEGTARDYAWAFRHLLQQRGVAEKGTAKMQSVTRQALPKIENFMKMPGFMLDSWVRRSTPSVPWDCWRCTYRNEADEEAKLDKCSMCGAPRDSKKVRANIVTSESLVSCSPQERCRPSCKPVDGREDSTCPQKSLGEVSRGDVCASSITFESDAGAARQAILEESEIELDEDARLRIAECDPRIQALLEAGSESSSCDES